MLVSYVEVVKSLSSGEEVPEPVKRFALLAASPMAYVLGEEDDWSDSESSSDKHVEETDDLAVMNKRD